MLTSVLTNSLQCRLETGFQHTLFTEGQAVGGLGYSPGRGLALGALLSQVLGGGARGLGLPILLAPDAKSQLIGKDPDADKD